VQESSFKAHRLRTCAIPDLVTEVLRRRGMIPRAVPTTIRPATIDDLGEILRIYNDAIRDTTATWDEAPWSVERRREWWESEHVDDRAAPVLVAEVDGQFAGFAYLSKMSNKSGWRFTREDTIYLDPRHQGNGVGRKLLGALLDLAKERGLRTIVASITAENAASIALHRRLGFELVGSIHNAGYKFDRWLDTTCWPVDLHQR
jgi:L-amino acid N-acyltransferase YncA